MSLPSGRQNFIQCDKHKKLLSADQSSISGMRRMRGSVKMSYSSLLGVLNSDTTAPSGPDWNQWRVLMGIVYCSPGWRITSCQTV